MKLQSILALAGASKLPQSAVLSIVPTIWDSHCFYPQPDASFDISTYEGRWYQVAGTLARFTEGCRCISALYSLNDDGSLHVNNTCTRGGKATFIEGQAVAADEGYGKVGVLRVRFPVQPSLACDGPNYIVQEYTGEIAIVQSHNFTNLFILSKKQQLPKDELESWIDRAVALGTPRDRIYATDQTNC